MTTKEYPRTLGSTVPEIYHNWINYPTGPGYIVVGFLPTVGTFSWLHGKLIKHEIAKNGMSVYRNANQQEIDLIDEGLELGWLQIQAQPTHGLIGGQCGGGTISQYECPNIILHQATGRKIEGKVKQSTIEIECMHCEKKFPVVVRDEQHLEELLSFPVGECADCLAAIDRMTDDEASLELSEIDI